MNSQKQQNHNQSGIDFFRKSGLAILFIILLCITGCEKLKEDSGKLEINGKSYLLDDCFYHRYSKNDVGLAFYSSNREIMVAVSLYDQSDDRLPQTGTFKMGGSKMPHITYITLYYDGIYDYGSDNNSSATLQSRRHKDSYDEYIYNFTLKGDIAGTNIKLTYKKNYR